MIQQCRTSPDAVIVHTSAMVTSKDTVERSYQLCYLKIYWLMPKLSVVAKVEDRRPDSTIASIFDIPESHDH